MSLAHAILGILGPGPLHGRAITRTLTAVLDGIRPVNPGQVYATLFRLTRDGRIVRLAPEPDDPRSTANQRYALLPAGRLALRRWLEGATVERLALGDFAERLVVLVALHDAPGIARLLDQHRARCGTLLRMLERAPSRHATLVQRAARRHLETELAWLTDAEQVLLPAPRT